MSEGNLHLAVMETHHDCTKYVGRLANNIANVPRNPSTENAANGTK